MDSYSLTVRRLNKDCSHDDYWNFHVFIKEFSEKDVKLETFAYEENKVRKGYHLHGLLSIRKGFLRRKIQKFGYYIYITPLKTEKDKCAWMTYIRKECYKHNLFKEITDKCIIS